LPASRQLTRITTPPQVRLQKVLAFMLAKAKADAAAARAERQAELAELVGRVAELEKELEGVAEGNGFQKGKQG
jgi:hypothetical protein